MSQTVSDFLTNLKSVSPTNHKIITTLRKLMKSSHPDTKERIMYGGIMFALDDNDVGGIFPYTSHVSFEFSHGSKLKDPKKLLEGSGKHRRHLKISTLDEIDTKETASFVSQLS